MHAAARDLIAAAKKQPQLTAAVAAAKKQPKLVAGALAVGLVWLLSQSQRPPAVPAVGVCWIRTGLNASNAARDLSAVAVAAATLRRYDPSVPRCLFADIDQETTSATLDALAKQLGEKPNLVLLVLAAPRLPNKRLAAVFAAVDEAAGHRFAAATSRLLALAAPPFGATLFLDDDALPCAPV